MGSLSVPRSRETQGPRSRRGSGPARAVRLLLAFLIALCGPLTAGGRAHAEIVDPEIQTDDLPRFGPFYLARHLGLKGLGYDDNLFLNQQDRVGDYTVTLGGGMRALLRGDRGHTLLLEGALDRVLYASHHDQDHTNGLGRAKFALVLKRALLTAEAQRLSQQERPNSEIDGRLRQTRDHYSLSARVEGPWRTSLQIGAKQTGIEFGTVDQGAFSDVPRRLNRTERAGSITARLQALAKTDVLLEFDRTGARFDDPSIRKDSVTDRTVLGAEFDPTALVAGAIRVGRIRLHALDRSDADFAGSVAEVELTSRIRAGGRIRVRYGRDVSFSSFEDQIFFVNREWVVAYAHPLSSRLAVELEGIFARSRYPDETTMAAGGGALQTARRTDLSRSIAVGLRFRTARGMWTGVRVVKWTRDSNFDVFDADRVAVMGVAEYAF